MEYTRDLGYCAAKYLLSGGNAVMISLQGGHFVPVPFSKMIDARTGRTKVRLVNIHSERYGIARRYMARLWTAAIVAAIPAVGVKLAVPVLAPIPRGILVLGTFGMGYLAMARLLRLSIPGLRR